MLLPTRRCWSGPFSGSGSNASSDGVSGGSIRPELPVAEHALGRKDGGAFTWTLKAAAVQLIELTPEAWVESFQSHVESALKEMCESVMLAFAKLGSLAPPPLRILIRFF